MAEVKKEEKKNPLQKLKEAVDDKEEQLAYLATLSRVIVLVWSAGILTLNYVEIPGYKQEQKIDPTFIASVFTGTLATFGVQTGGKKGRKVIVILDLTYLKRIWSFLLLRHQRLHLLKLSGLNQAPVKIVPNDK